MGDDSYGGPNPAQRPFRHPGGRTCPSTALAILAVPAVFFTVAARLAKKGGRR